MKIPVLFTTYNRLEYTKQALPALLESDCTEVLAFDNGSTDGTMEYLRDMQEKHPKKLRLFFNYKKNGIPGAMNYFFKKYKNSEWLAKVDNDTVVPQNWCHEMINVMKSHHLDIVQAKHHIIPAVCAGGWSEFVKQMPKLRDGLYENAFVGGSGVMIHWGFIKNFMEELKSDWLLGGWNDWQIKHSCFHKAFYEGVEVKLLDAHGYEDYPEYYKETGRL